MKNKKALKIGFIILAVIALAALTVLAFPYISKLKDSEARLAFSEKIRSFGFVGVLVMLLLQTMQVILAVIPGEPVEILMGMLYGTFGGLLMCLAGILIGTALIFFSVSRLGRAGIEKMTNSEKYRRFKFLQDPVKRDSLMFILFLIPGTPKDVLTYFAPCTGINPLRFLAICVVARIPSVVSSTYVGANILEGDILVSVAVLAATGLLGLVGIYFNNRFINKKNSQKKNMPSTMSESEHSDDIS